MAKHLILELLQSECVLAGWHLCAQLVCNLLVLAKSTRIMEAKGEVIAVLGRQRRFNAYEFRSSDPEERGKF